MARWPRAALLAFFTAGCGARSGLDVGAPECAPLSIGIFGKPGAYSGSDFEQWLRRSGADVKRVQTAPSEALTAATFKPFNVIVLDWLPRDYTAAEASAFADWIAAGGGVISMTGWDNVLVDDWHANSLLAPLGVAYSGPLLNGDVTDLAEHPITAGLTSVVFKGGYAISDLGGGASARAPIASLPAEGGDVNVGYAVEMGAGRAFVWGDEWIEFMSGDAVFQPAIWVQGFAWIAPPNACTLTPPR